MQVGRPYTVLFASGATHYYALKYFKTKFEALVGESWLPVSALSVKDLVPGLRVRDETPLPLGAAEFNHQDQAKVQEEEQLTSPDDGVRLQRRPSEFLASKRHAAQVPRLGLEAIWPGTQLSPLLLPKPRQEQEIEVSDPDHQCTCQPTRSKDACHSTLVQVASHA